MADSKISQLTPITGANLLDSDEFIVARADTFENFAVTRAELFLDTPDITTSDLTATTVDINGGTIDSTVIGGSTPAAGSFTTLDATGGGSLTGTWSDLGTVTTVDINGGTIDGTIIGGSTAAAISGTTGTFSGGLTVDTNTLFVDASANLVGIGTSSPAATLHVEGGNGVRIVDNFPEINLYDTDVSGLVHRIVGAGDKSLRFDVDVGNVEPTSVLEFFLDGSEAMRIDASGNVGIGTSSTSIDGLDARVLAQTTPSATNTAFAAYHATAVPGRSVASFFSNKSSVLTKVAEITTEGNAFFDGSVGIGTSSPGSKLSVVGLPTSATGLSAGDIWNDAGTLKIVT
jgi:hypothetical protein